MPLVFVSRSGVEIDVSGQILKSLQVGGDPLLTIGSQRLESETGAFPSVRSLGAQPDDFSFDLALTEDLGQREAQLPEAVERRKFIGIKERAAQAQVGEEPVQGPARRHELALDDNGP